MTMFRLNGVPANVRALPILQSASGSIASFNTDLTENLVEVKCQIVAQQSGSGTPSPDNVRPIQTYDSLTLYHNDVNMWDEQWQVYGSGATARIGSKNPIPCVGGRTYYLTSTPSYGWRFYDIEGNVVLTYYNKTCTAPNNAVYMMFQLDDTYGTVYNHDVSLNYPATDTEYHPFNGAYIPFGQTVANGVLDITTGKLRVTHGNVDLGSLNLGWDIYAYGASNMFYAVFNDKADGLSNFICSQYDNYSGGVAQMPDFTIRGQANAKTLFIRNTNYSDVPTFKSSLSGVQLVYELATPIEIQLDSIQLQALLNENNIWCDTGDTSVKYWMSINKYIGQ